MNAVVQNKSYELEYWRYMTREKAVARYTKAVEVFDLKKLLKRAKSVIDLGSGPYGGIFTVLQFPTMVAIDPLWDNYAELGYVPPEGVVSVSGHSGAFGYDGPSVDAVFSMNALDHSGDLHATAKEIEKHLKIGGIFVLHIHLRTRNQLNAGHKMALDAPTVIRAFDNLAPVWHKIVPVCPFDNKPYESLLGAWVK